MSIWRKLKCPFHNYERNKTNSTCNNSKKYKHDYFWPQDYLIIRYVYTALSRTLMPQMLVRWIPVVGRAMLEKGYWLTSVCGRLALRTLNGRSRKIPNTSIANKLDISFRSLKIRRKYIYNIYTRGPWWPRNRSPEYRNSACQGTSNIVN
jgi:hypothetical protein